MAVKHLAGQHIDELDAGMLKHGVGLRLLGEGDQIWLDHDLARNRMTEQLILVPCFGATPLDRHALSGTHIRAIALLLIAREERSKRHVERARERREAVSTRRPRGALARG